MCFREQHHLHFRSSERLYMPVLRITYSQQHYRLLFPGVSELYRTIFQMYIPVRLHHFLWLHPSRLQQSALCYRTLDYQEFLLTDYYNTHYNLIRHSGCWISIGIIITVRWFMDIPRRQVKTHVHIIF